MQGAADEAAEAYTKAHEADPTHTAATFRLAYHCDLHGDEEQAIELYRQCVEHTPVRANALLNLAVLYEDTRRLSEAERCLEDVLEEHPNHSRARQLLKSVRSSYTMVYDEKTQHEREQRDAVLDMSIVDFELSVRSRNCLRQMNIRTLGDLLNTTEAELLSYKNFGETSLSEIQAMLEQKGLTLGQALQPVEQTAFQDPASATGVAWR